MSFRTRLTLLFVVIVAVTLVGFGVLVQRLISASDAGKADARAATLAQAARRTEDRAVGRAAAATARVARDPALAAALARRDAAAAGRRLRALRVQAGLAWLEARAGGRRLAAAGDPRALAPARRRVRYTGSAAGAEIVAAALTPQALRALGSGPGTRIEITPGDVAARLPSGGERHVDAYATRTATGAPTTVAAMATAGAGGGGSRAAAVAVLAGFAALALLFALAVSRTLQAQIGRFLAAARRLAGGDFSQPVPVRGRDEFAQLGREFNAMAAQLEARLRELGRERGRLQESIQRIGQTFAANLDRGALLELGVRTAVDAVEADAGRARVPNADGGLRVGAEAGAVAGAHAAALADAEDAALARAGPAEARAGDVHALAAPLRPSDNRRRRGGLLAVARAGRPFSSTEREVFASLAGQAAVSLENVDLHDQVRRQAVTDELTGLANHRRFQERLAAELERARRFGHGVGLVMLDIDNFKRVNDSYGHPQGDEVLRAVARVLHEISREVDEPARYGGEEMALILPQTDLDGAYRVAERVRATIAGLAVPLLDGDGALRITASLGVAVSGRASPQALVAAADEALYEAKQTGKNRTVRGSVDAVDVVGGR